MGKIVVIGSSNMDMVVSTPHLPLPGETILGGNFFMNYGGKGANQAVAVKRLGGELLFLTKLGNDLFAKQTILYFKKEGIDTDYIITTEEAHSGVALISVDKCGENSIVVAPGANMLLDEKDTDKVIDQIAKDDILLIQLEIPISTVEYVIRRASEKGAKVILNPAPAQIIPEDLFPCIYLIIPNVVEAAMLAKESTEKDQNLERMCTEKLIDLGVKNVIVTMGSKGCFVNENRKMYYIDAFQVTPVDTTAAGDTFNGALAVALSEGMSLKESVILASKASSIAVTRVGAQSSIPYRNEL